MNKKELRRIVDSELSIYGFKEQSGSWYRQMPEVLQVVDLQESSYGPQFYINICCVPMGLSIQGMPTPKEHKCPVRTRLTSEFPEYRRNIEVAFDLECDDVDDSQRESNIREIVQTMMIPLFDLLKDKNTIKQSIERGVFRGLVSLKAREHLGMQP